MLSLPNGAHHFGLVLRLGARHARQLSHEAALAAIPATRLGQVVKLPWAAQWLLPAGSALSLAPALHLNLVAVEEIKGGLVFHLPLG